MFSDDNQQFLKSFGTQSQKSIQIKQKNELQQNEVFSKPKAPQLSINLKRKRNQSSINQEQRQNDSIQQKQPVAQLTSSKKFTLTTKHNKFRRFSQQKNIEFLSKVQYKDPEVSVSAKSEASSEIQQEKSNSLQKIQDKSNKSIKAKSYKYDVQQVQSSLMKKIRNLEARVKNMDLNYKTTILKLKNQHSKLQRQNNHIKQFLRQKYPNVLTEVTKYIQDKQQSDSQHFLDSSSGSSDHNNDQLMPIMSKIQQVKFDGQKLCQNVKNYQQLLKKKEKMQEEESMKQQKPEQNLSASKKVLLRKYSIPLSNAREKKQSFHTTVITDTKSKQRQNQSKTIQQEFICSNCKGITTNKKKDLQIIAN